MRHLKCDTPTDIKDAIAGIEVTADEVYKSLDLLRIPQNVAIWGVLTGLCLRIEDARSEVGETSHAFRAAMLNYGLIGTTVLNWITRHGSPTDENAPLVWVNGLPVAVHAAIGVGQQYQAFCATYPAWHQNYHPAELISPTVVRFYSPTGDQRRVSAYQKGHRPHQAPVETPDNDEVTMAGMVEMLERIVKTSEKFQRGFRYKLNRSSLEAMTTFYFHRLDAQFRRADDIGLGGYSIRDLREFYAALRALCNIHQYLCAAWQHRSGQYPANSAIIVKQRPDWIEFFVKNTKLNAQQVDEILSDLTLSDRPVDLHVHPFVLINKTTEQIGLIPHFPLNNRPDENILRMCSYKKPDVFSMSALSKESEMRDDLISTAPPNFHIPTKSIRIPDAGDLDFVVEDTASSTVVLAQLKWLRKTVHVKERIQQDAEIIKGIRQLRAAKEFLSRTPGHLRSVSAITNDLADYDNVFYVLIARDHFLWVDPLQDFPLLDHEGFKRMLASGRTLKDGMNELLTFDWLPMEGRDFHIRLERASVNGVTVELDGFYAGSAP